MIPSWCAILGALWLVGIALVAAWIAVIELVRFVRRCRRAGRKTPVTGLNSADEPFDNDGCAPLSDDEEWRLGEISMDSIIDVPEPAYDNRETS